jgi:hypothetical protein
VLPPRSIEVWGGEKENQLRRLGTVQPDFPAKDRPAARHIVTLAWPAQPLRYVRLVARNPGRLPAWHPLGQIHQSVDPDRRGSFPGVRKGTTHNSLYFTDNL